MARELDDWFDLSPVGMVLCDASGLMVRTNLAFDEIAGRVLVSLAEGAPDLAQLLAWGDGAALARLVPGSRAVERHGRVLQADGTARRLRASFAATGRPAGSVEERSLRRCSRSVSQPSSPSRPSKARSR